MADPMEVALVVRAVVADAQAKLAAITIQLEGLGAAGVEGATGASAASGALDAASASAAQTAAALGAANVGMAESAGTAGASLTAATTGIADAYQIAGTAAAGSAATAVAAGEDIAQAAVVGAAGAEAGAAAMTRVAMAANVSGTTLQALHPDIRQVGADWLTVDAVMAGNVKTAAQAADAEQALDRLMQAGAITATEQQAAIDALSAAEERYGFAAVEAAAATEAETSAIATGQSVREETALLDELMSGRIRRIPGTLAVLGSRLGITQLAFSAMGGAIVGAVAATGAFALAAIKGEEEESKFNAALAASNGYLGITFGQFRQAATDATSMGVSINHAKEAMQAVAASGQFTGDQIELVGKAALAMSDVTGLSVDKSVEAFTQFQDKPLEAIEALDERYHFLTAATQAQIQALEQQGDAQGAADLATKTAADHFQAAAEQVEQNLGYMQRAADATGHFFSRMWDDVEGVGRSNSQSAAQLSAELTSLKSQYQQALATADAGGSPATAMLLGAENLKSRIAAVTVEWQKETAAEKAAAAVAATDTTEDKLKAESKAIDDRNKQLDPTIEAQQTINDLLKEQVTLEGIASSSTAPPQQKTEAQGELTSLQPEIASAQQDYGRAAVQKDAATLQQLEAQDQVSYAKRSAFEQEFWAQKLAAATAGSATYDQIYQKLTSLDTGRVASGTSTAKQRTQVELAALQEQTAGAAEGSAARIADIQKELDFAKKAYGAESTEYIAAQQRMTEAKKQQADQQRQLDEIDVESAQSAALAKIDMARGASQQQLAMGQITATQETQNEILFENESYKIQQQALQKKLALEQQDVVATRQTQSQIEQLTQQHNLKLEQLTNQTMLNIRSRWLANLQPIDSAWQTSINGMIQGTQTLREGVENIMLSVVESYASSGEQMLMHWIATHLAMRAAAASTAVATQTTAETSAASERASTVGFAVANIMTAAAVAAAGAAASVADIPFVGWVMAPAVAAETYAATAAYAGLASAEGGQWEVPDVQLTMLHAHEMVLPAREAEGVRQMVHQGTSVGGDTHVHIHGDVLDAEGWFRRNSQALASGIKHARRNLAFV